MIRVLHIMDSADVGGISSVVLNYYRHMDRSKFCFEIALTTEQFGQDGRLLQALGVSFHRLPLKGQGVAAFEKALAALLKQKSYDAVHVHENETSYVALRIAKKCGVRKRFAHAHTSSPYGSVKGEIRRLSGCLLNAHYATCMIACGQLAGERVFGRRNMKKAAAVVLPNAIDTQKFAFDAEVREQVRGELQLEGKYVIGMVGRLSAEKNHAFALRLMAQLVREAPNALLLIVGGGSQETVIRHLAEQLGICEHVRCLGCRGDVVRLYQAMDLFLMPSLHEGFPVAAVEAMASGLPVLLSAAITRELAFGAAVQHIALRDSSQWLTAMKAWMTDAGRLTRGSEVRAQGLDINDTAQMLERLYLL